MVTGSDRYAFGVQHHADVEMMNPFYRKSDQAHLVGGCSNYLYAVNFLQLPVSMLQQDLFVSGDIFFSQVFNEPDGFFLPPPKPRLHEIEANVRVAPLS